MNIIYSKFKRKFSVSLFKNLKISLAEMTFSKDFVNDTNGDLYPIVCKSDDSVEAIKNNEYFSECGNTKRIFCGFFPFATYEMTFKLSECGKAGFCFKLPNVEACIVAENGKILYSCADERKTMPADISAHSFATLIVSCRPGAFDIYLKCNEKPEFLGTFYEDKFSSSNKAAQFYDGKAMLCVSGKAAVRAVSSYIDNGISVADIRPVKYENGDVIFENGKIYLTASVRMQEGAFQGMFSWVPGTAEISMTGAVFYDCGDGEWRGYVAPSVLYNRSYNKWYLWVSSFGHEHILAHADFSGDPRFGVNVIDVELMEKANEKSRFTDFVGFKGDEDPDFFFDENRNKWLMAICRINKETKLYSYAFFESDNPFDGYTSIGKGIDGCETGGSFVRIEGELFFVCGNGYSPSSEYRIYGKDGMKKASFDYPDGGFRGWGTVIPVTMGSRTRCFWLTFDRHNGSGYNWSYGNLYCFEANK